MFESRVGHGQVRGRIIKVLAASYRSTCFAVGHQNVQIHLLSIFAMGPEVSSSICLYPRLAKFGLAEELCTF